MNYEFFDRWNMNFFHVGKNSVYKIHYKRFILFLRRDSLSMSLCPFDYDIVHLYNHQWMLTSLLSRLYSNECLSLFITHVSTLRLIFQFERSERFYSLNMLYVLQSSSMTEPNESRPVLNPGHCDWLIRIITEYSIKILSTFESSSNHTHLEYFSVIIFQSVKPVIDQICATGNFHRLRINPDCSFSYLR